MLHFTLIAEVKTMSPFGWQSSRSWDELFELANACGDIISVHTDPRWGGSFDLIRKARSLTAKPILAKGIHATDGEVQKALEAGADQVLVVGRLPKLAADKCLIEPLALGDLASYPSDTKVVWNSRDLTAGSKKQETFAQARRQWQGWLCQASNIANVNDVQPDANAILVGSHLPEFVRSVESFR